MIEAALEHLPLARTLALVYATCAIPAAIIASWPTVEPVVPRLPLHAVRRAQKGSERERQAPCQHRTPFSVRLPRSRDNGGPAAQCCILLAWQAVVLAQHGVEVGIGWAAHAVGQPARRLLQGFGQATDTRLSSSTAPAAALTAYC